jgi:hypothetical protein
MIIKDNICDQAIHSALAEYNTEINVHAQLQISAVVEPSSLVSSVLSDGELEHNEDHSTCTH